MVEHAVPAEIENELETSAEDSVDVVEIAARSADLDG